MNAAVTDNMKVPPYTFPSVLAIFNPSIYE